MNSVGRFLSADPFSGSATAARSGSWNRYAYAEGNSVNANDPSGLSKEAECDADPSQAMCTWEDPRTRLSEAECDADPSNYLCSGEYAQSLYSGADSYSGDGT